MATRKTKSKVKPKSRSRSKVKTKALKAKAAPRKATPKPKPKKAANKRPAKQPVFDEGSTQQLAFAQIIGDIEERMALDRLAETK